MNLTRYTDYSLRVLLLLALRRDERVSIQQISDTYGISRNHLLKVVNRLGHLGYVETVRGRGGGLRPTSGGGDSDPRPRSRRPGHAASRAQPRPLDAA